MSSILDLQGPLKSIAPKRKVPLGIMILLGIVARHASFQAFVRA